MMSDDYMQIMLDEDGTAREYDGTYDFFVHCRSKEEQEKALTILSTMQWIPVSERLPDDWKDVLVWFEYFRYGDYNRMYSTYGIGNYSNQYDSWWINHESGWTDLHVFAWMPMPEPYEEGDNE